VDSAYHYSLSATQIQKEILNKEEQIAAYKHIRTRPGMYLGQINTLGFLTALEDLLISTISIIQPKTIEIDFTNSIRFRISFHDAKGSINKNTLNTTIKLRNYSYLFDLSSFSSICNNYQVVICDKSDSTILTQSFSKGHCHKELNDEVLQKFAKIELDFDLEKEIWGDNFKLNFKILDYKLKEFSYLNSDRIVIFRYPVKQFINNSVYYFDKGLLDKLNPQVNQLIGGTFYTAHITPIHEHFKAEIAFAIRRHPYSLQLNSYVNYRETLEHGTHVDSIIEGILKGINGFLDAKNETKIGRVNLSQLEKQLILNVNLLYSDARWAGSFKTKLVNAEIIEPLSDSIKNQMIKDLSTNPNLIEDFLIYFDLEEGQQITQHDQGITPSS